MAKTRKKSAKAARPARRPSARKKSAPRKARTASRGKAPARRVLSLKKLQADLRRAVAILSSGTGAAAMSAQASETQERFTRWASEIDQICAGQEFCGPTMDVPLN